MIYIITLFTNQFDVDVIDDVARLNYALAKTYNMFNFLRQSRTDTLWEQWKSLTVIYTVKIVNQNDDNEVPVLVPVPGTVG